MAKAVWVGGRHNQSVSAGVTNYLVVGNCFVSTKTTEADSQWTINRSGTFCCMAIQISANATTSDSTMRFRVDTANGNQVITIGSGQTGNFIDPTNKDTVSAGAVLTYSVTAGDTGSLTYRTLSCIFDPGYNTAVMATFAGNSWDLTTANVTRHHGFGAGGVNNGNSTESQAQSKINTACTLKNFAVRVLANSRTSNVVFKTRVAGADGTLTQTYTSGQTGYKEDNSNSDAVTSGQLCNFATVTSSGTAGITIAFIKVDVESTNGQFPMFNTAINGLASTAGSDRFGSIGGQSTLYTTEAEGALYTGGGFSFTNLWINITANSTNATNRIGLRKNSGDAVLFVEPGAGATGAFEDTSRKADIITTDKLATLYRSGGTGTYTYRGFSYLGFENTTGGFMLV